MFLVEMNELENGGYDAHLAWRRAGRVRWRVATRSDVSAPLALYDWPDLDGDHRWVAELDARIVAELRFSLTDLACPLEPAVELTMGILPEAARAPRGATLVVGRLACFDPLPSWETLKRLHATGIRRLAVELGVDRVAAAVRVRVPNDVCFDLEAWIQQARWGAVDAGPLSLAASQGLRPRLVDPELGLVWCEWENPTRI